MLRQLVDPAAIPQPTNRELMPEIVRPEPAERTPGFPLNLPRHGA